MRFNDFCDLYASRFRPLTEQDGLAEWIRDIEKQDVVEDIMRSALNAIFDHHNRLSEDGAKLIAAPRLGEVMAAYHRAAEVSSRPGQAQAGKYRPLPYCGACNKGYMWVLVDLDKAELVDPRTPADGRGRTVAMRTICTYQVDVNGQPGELPDWYTPDRRVAEEALRGMGQEARVVSASAMMAATTAAGAA